VGKNLSFKIVILCCLALTLGSLNIIAQHNVRFDPSNFKNDPEGFKFAVQRLNEGNQYIRDAEYQMALPYFLSADSINPNNADLNAKIGVCYLNSYCKARCLQYFRKAYSINNRISKRIHFFLARGYHLNCQWDSAITEYQLALKKASKKEKRAENFERDIEECNNGKDLASHPVKTKIENLGASINSPYKDFRPYVVADESRLIFTSQRPDSNGVEQDPSTGEYIQAIYSSSYKDDKWTNAQLMSPATVNGPDNNQSAYVTPDGKSIFVYRDLNGGDIYLTNYAEQAWQECLALSDTINTPFRETSVCLSPNGKTIFFVSSRPGGKGGQDIYVAHKVSAGSWSKPVNLGDTLINTPYDEDGVFMNPDGKTLYFSSKGHNSMGGYDIFVTQYDSVTDQCTPPKNLGFPINTPDDDVYFSTSDHGRFGYYGSFRDSINNIGGYDIYRVYMDAFMPKELVLKGMVVDSVSGKTLNTTATITDKTSNTTSTMKLDSNTGKYYIVLPAGHQYEVKISAKDFADYVYNTTLPDTMSFREIDKKIYMVKPKVMLASSSKRDSCIPNMTILMQRFNGLASDTNIVRAALQNLDTNLCLKEMKFMVQIGAYTTVKHYRYKKYGIKESDVKTFVENASFTTDKGKASGSTITRFATGSFETYEEAKEYKMKLIKKGIKGAFVIGAYNNTRVDLKQLLHHPMYQVQGSTGTGQKTEE